jgi:hypothetical protein
VVYQWCINGVTTCKKSRHAAVILNLDVKDHVAQDLLVGWGNFFFPNQYLKCNADILHLLPYRILSEGVAILFIKSHTVILTLWDLNYKLVNPLVIPLCHSSNTMAALLEHIWDPTNKIRGIKKVLGYRVFRNFNRDTFFQVSHMLTARCTTFPFNTQLATLGCLPEFCVTPVLDVHISAVYGVTIHPVINNTFHVVVLLALSITLRIHVLRYDIDSILINVAIRELDLISPCVQN